MTRLAVVIGLALLFGVAGYVAAYLAYRTFKLNLLEPRRLQAPIQWTGDSYARCTALLVRDSRYPAGRLRRDLAGGLADWASPEKRLST